MGPYEIAKLLNPKVNRLTEWRDNLWKERETFSTCTSKVYKEQNQNKNKTKNLNKRAKNPI